MDSKKHTMMGTTFFISCKKLKELFNLGFEDKKTWFFWNLTFFSSFNVLIFPFPEPNKLLSNKPSTQYGFFVMYF